MNSNNFIVGAIYISLLNNKKEDVHKLLIELINNCPNLISQEIYNDIVFKMINKNMINIKILKYLKKNIR